jgi:hypothetical protein
LGCCRLFSDVTKFFSTPTPSESKSFGNAGLYQFPFLKQGCCILRGAKTCRPVLTRDTAITLRNGSQVTTTAEQCHRAPTFGFICAKRTLTDSGATIRCPLAQPLSKKLLSRWTSSDDATRWTSSDDVTRILVSPSSFPMPEFRSDNPTKRVNSLELHFCTSQVFYSIELNVNEFQILVTSLHNEGTKP